jgi:hypothetical protein
LSEKDKALQDSRPEEMYSDLKRTKKEAQMWKNKFEALSKSGGKGEVSAVPDTKSGNNQPIAPPNEAPAHSFKFFQQYCTDCGEKNPEFKDETACKGCGMHLGAVEAAMRMKACPSCGAKDLKALSPEALEKARAVVAPA